MSDADQTRLPAPSPAELSSLVTRLDHESFAVRIEAAKELGRVGGEPAAQALITRLEIEKDHWVQDAIVTALGTMGGEQASLALIKKLGEESFSQRDKVAKALGEIGGDLAATALIDKLRDRGENWLVRAHVVQALGIIGGERVTKALIETLNNPADYKIHEAVISALREIEGYRAPESTERESQGSGIAMFLATHRTYGATIIGSLSAIAAVVILQAFVNPSSVIVTGAIAAVAGLLAYAGWSAATDPDAGGTGDEVRSSSLTLRGNDVKEMIDTYLEAQRLMTESGSQ